MKCKKHNVQMQIKNILTLGQRKLPFRYCGECHREIRDETGDSK